MRKILLIVIIIGVILGVFYFVNKNEAVAPVIVAPIITDNKLTELCFAKFGVPDENGLFDKYTLRLDLNGEKVTGELNFLPAEKDSKTGEIKGIVGKVDPKMMARQADLWWFTFAEGMNTEEELKIIFGEGTANIGFGEMIDRGDGVYVYKDPGKVSYQLELSDVACLDLTERASVEDYLRENISTLSPVKAVLGGTWYIMSMTIDLGKNSGTVFYEDGHIQEKRNFSYTTNEKHKITNLTIH